MRRKSIRESAVENAESRGVVILTATIHKEQRVGLACRITK